MLFVETLKELRSLVAEQKQQGRKVVLVPTMGNLHEGHLQLVDIARKNGDFVICSIFVNPTQFGEGEDFDKYPRTLEADSKKLEERACDLLFFPAVAEVYPGTTDKNKLSIVHVPGVSEGLCGGSRPGHFDGVSTVVSKLFNMITPDAAVFGEKDFQQLAVIRKFTVDLNFPVEIISAPIVREENGLAMSSRNGYLNEAEKEQASFLYKLLNEAKQSVLNNISLEEIEKESLSKIKENGFKPDYFEIRNANNLLPATKEDKELVILLAAFLGKTRLIDNLSFSR